MPGLSPRLGTLVDRYAGVCETGRLPAARRLALVDERCRARETMDKTHPRIVFHRRYHRTLSLAVSLRPFHPHPLMENHGGQKRKRGRPRTHATSKAKAAADVKRRRFARQDASFHQRDTAHTNFYNSFLPLQCQYRTEKKRRKEEQRDGI